MVLRGQFLERPTIVPSGGAYLDALSHRGEKRPGLLILAPHPSRGGSMDSPVCAELAFSASQRGHPTLRFNYRGVGASQGELSDRAGCVEDARAALGLLRENVGHEEIVLAGYDFGAEVALELALSGEALVGVAVIAPVTSAYDFSPLASLKVPGLVVVGQRDPMGDRRALAELCQGSGDELVVIPGADHVFSVGLTSVGRAVAAFLAGERAGDAIA
ncbi:MAG: alpha/beta hydrolase [Myxococcales bacterium]|jgi:alpha/beta superfamily hydrolase